MVFNTDENFDNHQNSLRNFSPGHKSFGLKGSGTWLSKARCVKFVHIRKKTHIEIFQGISGPSILLHPIELHKDIESWYVYDFHVWYPL